MQLALFDLVYPGRIPELPALRVKPIIIYPGHDVAGGQKRGQEVPGEVVPVGLSRASYDHELGHVDNSGH